MIVLIDNGHGSDTKGKRSPDGEFLEYAWARLEAKLLSSRLCNLGIQSYILVPEDRDISLAVRAARVNEYCKHLGRSNVLLISLHCDAQPGCDKQWGSARGLTSIVYTGAGSSSRKLASLITDSARELDLLGNRSTPSCGYREQNLAILRETQCPAVLVECGFMTNQEDVAFMRSYVGQNKIATAIAKAVENYVNNYAK